MKISDIKAREVLDSRGNPTIEVDVILESGDKGSAIVPSGASTGSKEALELRDKDPNRYRGKGVQKAVNNIHQIIKPNLIGKECINQEEIDNLLIEWDGTNNKSKLGANAILGVSMALAQAAANYQKEPLYVYLNKEYSNNYVHNSGMAMPVPMMNILNGGAHANNSVDIQEFMIIPHNAKSYSDALRQGVEVFHQLKDCLNEKKLSTAVGDEGGFAPSLPSNKAALELLIEAIEKAGYQAGKDISLSLDVAATELYKEDGNYHFKGEGSIRSTEDMILYYEELIRLYPIVSIEDGLDETDWDGWKRLTERIGTQVQLVGDDLFVTNPAILEKGISNNIANSILIKLNQIGTVSETLKAIAMAQKASYSVVVSHRSGESEDTFIADLSVATKAGQIKTGSLCRSDRVSKYNQLLRIEETVAHTSEFLGKHAFAFTL
ncbi:phosphopyruvate hydratase [bacterium]|nr:phosphopyruvate hydratase [bacterium]|tara:strand:+ start:1656 stop:2963 length:1308 start_codon:yes stop_codon:yes gene_type:complete